MNGVNFVIRLHVIYSTVERNIQNNFQNDRVGKILVPLIKFKTNFIGRTQKGFLQFQEASHDKFYCLKLLSYCFFFL